LSLLALSLLLLLLLTPPVLAADTAAALLVLLLLLLVSAVGFGTAAKCSGVLPCESGWFGWTPGTESNCTTTCDTTNSSKKAGPARTGKSLSVCMATRKLWSFLC
jgi:hypothetical protein